MTAHPLIDDRIVAQTFAMRRVVQQPELVQQNPIMPDAQAYGSVLRDHTGQWRMWYLGEPVYSGYYAVSEDGRNWQRPALDLVAANVRGELNGPNAFMCHGQKDVQGRWLVGEKGPEGFSVLDAELTPHPAAKARFTALYLARTTAEAGMYIAHSDDGVRWFGEDRNPVIEGWRDTSSVLLYDPTAGNYVWYGRPLAHAATVMHANRVIARKQSDDLIHWTPDQTVMDTDDSDADAYQLLDESAIRAGNDAAMAEARAAAWAAITEGSRRDGDLPLIRGRNRQWYGITVFPWADLYLGLAWLYDLPSGDMWTELVRSVDGIDWRREAQRTPFIPRLPSTCSCTMASPPVTVGDDVYIFDSVNNRSHHGVPNPNVEKGIRLWSLRRDRWIGYTAGNAPGELLTQAIDLPRALLLNAAIAADGSLQVAVTDADGRPLDGLTRDDCEPLTGDGLDLTPRWRSGKTLADVTLTTVRLRLHARRASLFALQLSPDPNSL